MFLNLKSIAYAIIFFTGLQLLFLNVNLVWYVAIFLTLFSIISARKITGRHIFSTVPVIFTFSAIMLFYLIDLSFERQFFIILSSFIYYLIFLGIYRLKNYSKDQTAKGIISGGLAFTIFFFYAGFYGLYLNFSIPLWFLMLVFLASTFVLSFYYFNIISNDKKKILSYSLILGLSMAEISWVVNFWPFGYLTTGVIALIFYYVFWDLTQSYFMDNLSKEKVVKNLIFFSLLIGLILFSSKWQLAV